MKNKLVDLNNHLFEQLERLNDNDLKGENLQEEIQRAKAMSDIAKNIIDNGNLVLSATKYTNDISYNQNTQAIVNTLLLSGEIKKDE